MAKTIAATAVAQGKSVIMLPLDVYTAFVKVVREQLIADCDSEEAVLGMLGALGFTPDEVTQVRVEARQIMEGMGISAHMFELSAAYRTICGLLTTTCLECIAR